MKIKIQMAFLLRVEEQPDSAEERRAAQQRYEIESGLATGRPIQGRGREGTAEL